MDGPLYLNGVARRAPVHWFLRFYYQVCITLYCGSGVSTDVPDGISVFTDTRLPVWSAFTCCSDYARCTHILLGLFIG